MDQPTGDPKPLFEAIVCHMEMMKRAREYDNTDYSGNNVPTSSQIEQAVSVLAKARELRRILNG